MEQLEGIIIKSIETLRSSKKKPNEEAIHNVIKKYLPEVSMDKLKERLNHLLQKEKILNKPHKGKNSYYNIKEVCPETPHPPSHPPEVPHPPSHPPETPVRKEKISNQSNDKIDMSAKLKEYVKTDTFETFFEMFLEFRYSVNTKFEKYFQENFHAYGLSEDTVTFIYSYLKRRKQGVKINNTESLFQILLSGIPQGSILGPILFNIFINDLFLFLEDVDLANFADDNTIYTANKNIEVLIKLLERESKSAIDWFKMNDMIVNPDKFQAMILRPNKKENKFQLNINDSIISSEDSVTLLGIEIDSKLNFKNHVSKICRKAGWTKCDK